MADIIHPLGLEKFAAILYTFLSSNLLFICPNKLGYLSADIPFLYCLKFHFSTPSGKSKLFFTSSICFLFNGLKSVPVLISFTISKLENFCLTRHAE